MSDMPDTQPAPPAPANGVSVAPPTTPMPAAPTSPQQAPAALVDQPKESWFKGFDWMKVLGYSVLVIVGVAYVKYTRDRATKDAADIADLKSSISNLTLKIDSPQASA